MVDGFENDWGSVRIRSALITKIEKHVKKHPELGNVSSFVSHVINQEIEN
jgi:hypothetical protein